MSLGFSPQQGAEQWQQDFILALQTDLSAPTQIQEDKKAGQRLYMLSLSSQDMPRFRQTQKRLLQIQQQEIQGKGMFGLGVSHFCVQDDWADRAATANIYMRLTQGSDYIPLFKEFELVTDKLELSQLQCSQQAT